MTNYHHAGTTFYLKNDGSINTSATNGGKTLRTGFTAQKSAITDPLTPRTDNDYIYFTDTSNNNEWGNTVYAYYYGGEDGEYTAWPGIKATTTVTSNEAPTTYKDNSGYNVFMFQLPTVANGKYPYVIFNTGNANNRKVTQAIRIMNNDETAYSAAGNNYSVNTSGTNQYGTYDSTASHYVNAYPVKSTSKNSNPTVSYADSDKYIYIINNGTYTFDLKSSDDSDINNKRYILDDMHVVFYDAGGSVIGSSAPGYKPDKVGQKDGKDVYRIIIPSGAVNFQINNGSGKGNATTSHNHYRRSEIKSITPNGLYKFIDDKTDAKDIWNNSSKATSVSKLNDHLYYLTLDNKDTTPTDDTPPETSTEDIKLATIVTDADGSQKYIKWLKGDAQNIDTKYLNHTSSDVGEHAPNGTTDTGVKTVKVVKLGDYYWVESKAPEGYKINTTPTQFTITGDETTTVSSEIEDEPLPKGSLTLTKTAYGAEATDSFTFTITLSNTDVTWSRYTLTTDTTGTDSSITPVPANAEHPTQWSVTLKNSGTATIDDIPLGTTYAVSENGNLANWNTAYKVNGGSETNGTSFLLSDGYTITEKDEGLGNTVEFINRNKKEPEPEGEVILTKTAKEKVGTIDIGAPLAGAKFKLVDVNETDSTKVIKFKLTQVDPDTTDTDTRKTNIYTVDNSGSYNVTYSWLETGEDGKLHIKGLSIGDYYLEEQAAPNGYSHLDSSTDTNKKIYFSVGANRAVKEISATDEMAPAYIKLYEHINEKRDEWGDPTFVFKIKQTGYYAWSTAATPTWEYTTTDSGKEILVALTVDDNKNITNVVKWFNPTGINFDADKIDNTTYGDWLVEGTTDLEDYQGIFDIDSKGRIRVEPGSYEITRVPVSRYEFVTNGKTAAYDNDTLPHDWTEYTVNGNKSEKLKIGEDNNGTMVGLLEPGKTIDVHYYDKVGYYDKFSQVDEEINKFYTLDENTKANKTIKGIRIADYHQTGNVANGDTDNDGKMEVNVDDLTIYKIMSDGTEVPMKSTEKADISVTYTYAADDDKKFGGDSANSVPAQFSYANQKITVTGASTFAKGVYTLNANYKGFTTSFDIVFLTASS